MIFFNRIILSNEEVTTVLRFPTLYYVGAYHYSCHTICLLRTTMVESNNNGVRKKTYVRDKNKK